jgi:hypothetical protein
MKETAILIGAIAVIATITVEYVKGTDRISCDRQNARSGPASGSRGEPE